MYRAAAFLMTLILSTVVYANDDDKYIGFIYPPKPPGFEEKGGALVLGDARANGLWYSFVEIDHKPMNWLIRMIDRVGKDPVWRVEDVFPEVQLMSGETWHMGFDIECTFKGKPDASLIAVGQWKNRVGKGQVGGYAHHIRLAWRVNEERAKFEPVPARDVRCELNEDRN
jgi:hypothetical protein